MNPLFETILLCMIESKVGSRDDDSISNNAK